MKTINYISTSYSPWEQLSQEKRALLAAFIEDIPYLMFSRVIPSREAINEVLLSGELGGGMSPGAKWESFQITEEEYEEAVQYWLNTEGNSELSRKNPDKYLLDKEITREKTHLGYVEKTVPKYRKKGIGQLGA